MRLQQFASMHSARMLLLISQDTLPHIELQNLPRFIRRQSHHRQHSQDANTTEQLVPPFGHTQFGSIGRTKTSRNKMAPTQQDIKNKYINLAVDYLPCSKAHPSQYHELSCKHTVETDTIVACGLNCKYGGEAPKLICHQCISNQETDSAVGSVGEVSKLATKLELLSVQEYRDSKPAQDNEWVAVFFSEHPEAIDDKESKKVRPHRLGQGFWQFQEIQRTLTGLKDPVEKRTRRMTWERR